MTATEEVPPCPVRRGEQVVIMEASATQWRLPGTVIATRYFAEDGWQACVVLPAGQEVWLPVKMLAGRLSLEMAA